jgi:hypothetical protein
MKKINVVFPLLILIVLVSGCTSYGKNSYKIEPQLSCIHISEDIIRDDPGIIIENNCDKGFSFYNYSLPWLLHNNTMQIYYYFEYYDNNVRKACSCSLKFSPDYNTTCSVEDFPKDCSKNYYCLSNYECKNLILPNTLGNMVEIKVFGRPGKWYLIGDEVNITGEVIFNK